MKSVSEIFSEKGSLSGLIQDYQYRPEQDEMAQLIFSAIEQGEDLICEAGTGTGKTMAYLLPALMSSKKTIVSTGTRHLQDQLKQKDLPIVLDALNQPLTTTVLKGRANYLCKQRLAIALHDSQGLSDQQMTALQAFKAWSSSTGSGDVNELDLLEDNASIRSLVTSTTENCLGQGCPEYDTCFVFKNRQAALEADLVITNHHLLLADMGLRESGFGEVLPLADVIVFDEAHQLPELASTYFSQTLSTWQLLELNTDIRLADREEAGDIKQLEPVLTCFEKNIRDVRLVFGRKDRRVNWQAVWDQTTLSTQLPLLLAAFQAVLDCLEVLAPRGKMLDNCWQRAKAHYNFIEAYAGHDTDEIIRWVDIRGLHLYLNQTPVNIAETFQKRIKAYNASNIFISASLAVNNDFKHFSQQLGLTETAAQIWDSPFDYKKQTALYLPLDLPEPGQAEFFDAFIERSLRLISFSQGRAFILFTSHAALARAANIFRERVDYPLFIQGQGARSALLNQFRTTPNAILLGTGSFWEGVDVRGEALSLVVIDKLPFASPDDPVLQARLNYLSKQGHNAFMEHQVPLAAITLKQGIGRLIRDTDDRGVCVICDKRIVQKAYGKRLLTSLPPMPVTHEIDDIEQFFIHA